MDPGSGTRGASPGDCSPHRRGRPPLGRRPLRRRAPSLPGRNGPLWALWGPRARSEERLRMSAPGMCTRCSLRPRVPKQRWCGPCRAEYKRRARGTQRGTAGNGMTANEGSKPGMTKGAAGNEVIRAGQAPAEKAHPAPPPPAPYVPFTGTQAPREPWYVAFLSDLATNGGISLAAAAAGVHRNRVYRRIDDDPEFAE